MCIVENRFNKSGQPSCLGTSCKFQVTVGHSSKTSEIPSKSICHQRVSGQPSSSKNPLNVSGCVGHKSCNLDSITVRICNHFVICYAIRTTVIILEFVIVFRTEMDKNHLDLKFHHRQNHQMFMFNNIRTTVCVFKFVIIFTV